jgi:hypothetical protein
VTVLLRARFKSLRCISIGYNAHRLERRINPCRESTVFRILSKDWQISVTFQTIVFIARLLNRALNLARSGCVPVMMCNLHETPGVRPVSPT